jgi:hypothetical protein
VTRNSYLQNGSGADCSSPTAFKASRPPPQVGGVIVLKSKYYFPSAEVAGCFEPERRRTIGTDVIISSLS